MPEKRHGILQQKDGCVSCGFLPVTFAARRRLSSCATNMGFSAVWSHRSVPRPHLDLPPARFLPWDHPAPAKRYWSSASPAAHAEAREHCQNGRGGSGSFSRLLRPFGNHQFPGNMFQMWSFRQCASSESRAADSLKPWGDPGAS